MVFRRPVLSAAVVAGFLFLGSYRQAARAAEPNPAAPAPPGGTLDKGLTQAASDRLKAEMKAALAELDRDSSRPEGVKRLIRDRMSRLRVFVYTSSASLEDVVTFYEKNVPDARFSFGRRNLLFDAAETAQAGGFTLKDGVAREWEGKPGVSARWHREDNALAIEVEDHLVDPRDGSITKKTVVMVSAVN